MNLLNELKELKEVYLKYIKDRDKQLSQHLITKIAQAWIKELPERFYQVLIKDEPAIFFVYEDINLLNLKYKISENILDYKVYTTYGSVALEINKLLSPFGIHLYKSGNSYSYFIETIDLISYINRNS